MLSSPPDGSLLFGKLAVRPPTPPRDTSNDPVFSPETSKNVDAALDFLEQGHSDPAEQLSSSHAHASAHTTPSRAPQSRASTATKKVDFLSEPTVHSAGTQHSPRIPNDSPALRASSGPLRSILKRSIELLPPTPDDVDQRLSYFSPQEPGSFRKMLHSVLKQLGGASRDGRRDAYLCLNGALKQYSDLPDRDAMAEKMDLLQQFISRDMAWKDHKGGLDVQIVTQALNLTSALLWDPTTARSLDDDFRTFIVDRSMIMLEQTDVPKSVLKAHVHILMVQQFHPSIMTPSKVERILTALQNIEERCSGNSIIAARLNVYQRLVSQQPSIMISRMPDWMQHVFGGMLSSSNDNLVQAIEACHHAALVLGTYSVASRTLFEIFEAQTDEGVSYCEHFNKKLMEKASNKNEAPFVPQIWGAIILFFRTKRKPIDRWQPKLRVFLETIQRCLNSGDITVKHQAHVAWHKLMFAVQPDSTTTSTMRSMLRLPIVSVLERRGSDKFSQQAKDLALQSYCHLLHYGLRPSLSHEELDEAWKLYVEEVLPKLTKSGRQGRANACRLLHGLLQRKKGTWNENAAIESTPIRPEDLPQLDSKWIRSRLGKIIQVLEPIIVAGMCLAPNGNNGADVCWKLLLQAVAEAGSNEVKTSNELKVALAELTNFLRRLWRTPGQTQSELERSLWLDRYQALLETCVEILGPAHFVEDFLAKTNSDEVEATPTPSNRVSKHQKTAYPPFVFLFALYYQPPQNCYSPEPYISSATRYLTLLAGARGSVSGTIGLLHRTLQFCSDQVSLGGLREQLWCAVVERAVVECQTPTPAQHNSQAIGVALRSALNIITFGLRQYHSDSNCIQRGIELYTATCRLAKQLSNDGGIALGVMEPLAKSLIDMQDEIPLSASLQLATAVLAEGVWPRNRQDLEHSRKTLWSVSLDPPSKMSATTFDPFDHVYDMVKGVTQRAYNELTKDFNTSLAELLAWHIETLIEAFLQRCPPKTLPSSLKRTQEAVVVLALDRSRLFFPLQAVKKDLESMSDLPSMWSSFLDFVQRVPSAKDSSLLSALESLLIGGFASPSRDIVNATIKFWNETFGQQDSLEYPQGLLPVLRSRSRQTELQLPGLQNDDTAMELADLPVFADSQEDSSNRSKGGVPSILGISRPTSRSSKLERPFGHYIKTTEIPVASETASPGKSPRRSKASRKLTPKARLRHDDSQMEFAPIEPLASGSSNEESQLLTDHQKEVQIRQHGDAQMFPELSSSPVQSGRKNKTIAKKLDFSSDAARARDDNENVATPTGLADANPMSDDLPSSPTPRASATAPAIDQDSDDDATDILDPPSSPPREAVNDHAQYVNEINDNLATEDDRDVPPAEVEPLSGQDLEPRKIEIVPEEATLSTDARVSDNVLPTAQLEREAAAAAAAAGEEHVQESGSPEQPLDTATAANGSGLDNSQAVPGHKSPQVVLHSQSRIPESFVEQVEQTPSHDKTTDQVSSAEQRSSKDKKRRRPKETAASPLESPLKKAKKDKKVSGSPIKNLWNRLVSASSRDDDVDEGHMSDEIVVASKPRASQSEEQASQSSPQGNGSASQQQEMLHGEEDVGDKRSKRRRGRPRKSHSQAEPDPTVQDVVSSQSSVRRGRGRPKANTRDSVQAPNASSGQKRRAADISDAGDSYVADTPAPTTRKATRLSQGTSDAGSSLRQAASQEAESALQAVGNQSPARRPTSPAPSPRSILARLYGVLADIPKIVFGSQEDERAFDDVLFEIRREVHEAGRTPRRLQQ